MSAKPKTDSSDRMQRALSTALPPEVAARLARENGHKPAADPAPAQPAPSPAPEALMRVVPSDDAEHDQGPEQEQGEAEVEPVRARQAEPSETRRPAAKPSKPRVPATPAAARHTRHATADLGELDLGERIRQITTRMPISLADRLDIAVLRQKRTNGDLRSIQAIMLAGAERVLDELEGRAA